MDEILTGWAGLLMASARSAVSMGTSSATLTSYRRRRNCTVGENDQLRLIVNVVRA